jgi:hypothetical protein
MRKFANQKWWLLTMLMTIPVIAIADGVPNVFKSGEVIASTPMNDNFKNLADRVTALEAAVGPQPNPWVKAGDNTSKAVWDVLVAKYPPDKYEWGNNHNSIAGEVHKVTFSSWNQGIRITTEEYLEGDGDSSDPTAGFWMGGSAWFYDTNGTFDDVCTAAGSFKHQYWQRSATGITFRAGNGCGGGDSWYVRLR